MAFFRGVRGRNRLTAISINPLQFWGKASPSGDEAERFHPLVFHALDVAAVFGALTEADAESLGILASSFAASGERIVATLTVLVALHDIGKVSKKFQAKCEDAWPTMLGALSSELQAPYDHAAGGYELLLRDELKPILARLLGEAEFDEKQALLSPIAFHHGKPQDRHPNGTSSPGWDAYNNARIVADAMLSAFDMSSVSALPPIGTKAAKDLSWQLSGLVSLADWIGSSTEFFHHCDPRDFSPRDYWSNVAQPKAREALHTLRMTPSKPNQTANFATLFKAKWSPGSAQAHCGEFELPAGPMLVFIEDVTGSEKTESALLLAQRMMVAGKGRGLLCACTKRMRDASDQSRSKPVFKRKRFPPLRLHLECERYAVRN